MDPPFKLKYNFGDFKPKFKKALKVLVFNSLATCLFVAIAYYLILNSNEIKHVVRLYKGQWGFFLPISRSNFNLIFWNYSLIPAITEETLYRGPLCVLLRQNFKILTKYSPVKLFSTVAISISFILWPETSYLSLFLCICGLPVYRTIIKYLYPIIQNENDITKPFLIVLVLILNSSWAMTHEIFLPIFLAGLPLYWLIFKTKSLWTSIICHCSFNLSIYFSIQLAIRFGLIK